MRLDQLPNAEAVLKFWFALKRPGKKDDARVTTTLGPALNAARRGVLVAWATDPRERLALVLLLDQVSRHVYRGLPEQYAGDPASQQLARQFVEQEDWRGFTPLERYHAVAPWLHAEVAALQMAVNPILHQLAAEDPALAVSALIGDLYRDTIICFGRFPHRNKILGRETTDAERVFLQTQWRERKRIAHRAG